MPAAIISYIRLLENPAMLTYFYPNGKECCICAICEIASRECLKTFMDGNSNANMANMAKMAKMANWGTRTLARVPLRLTTCCVMFHLESGELGKGSAKTGTTDLFC